MSTSSAEFPHGVGGLSIKTVAQILGGEVSGDEVVAPGPGHSSRDRSLCVKLDPQAPDGLLVHSFAGDDPMACKRYVLDKLGIPAGHGVNGTHHKTIVAIYDYTDEAGDLLFQTVRYQPKGFGQRRPDGKGGWDWSTAGLRRVLYRLSELLEAVALGQTIFIAEGEKAVDALMRLGVPATCSPMGAGKWREEYCNHLAKADVVLLPDNDELGENHCRRAAESLMSVGAKVRVLRLPGLPPKGDVYDWVRAGGTADQLWHLVENTAVEWTQQPKAAPDRLSPLCIHELFELEIPQRGMVLDPIIPEKGLAMVYAPRGVGKTHVACAISSAVATGTMFLKWQAPKPRKVIHVDGEMPAADLRERFRQTFEALGVTPDPGMLRVLPADLIELGIGNLASPEVQMELDRQLDGVELLVLDNLSSLTSVIRDNDAESWTPIQEWLLRLRRRGISVLIVHHAGKGGEQRGTSRREDVLDTSLSLRRPSDYEAPQGARFEVHFEKGRGIHGHLAKPFEARLEVVEGAASWSIREIEDVNLARVKALLEDGASIRDIADETGLSKSTVHRLKKQIDAAREESHEA
jgi:putative DNA primase/helicase